MEFKTSFRKLFAFTLGVLFAFSVNGGVPVTFYQINPVFDKEFSAELSLSGSYSGLPDIKGHFGVHPGIKTFYSLRNNLLLLSSFYYDFIPYRSQIIGIGVTELKIYPSSINYNVGLSYFPQSKQDLSNRYSLSFGMGRTLIESNRHNLDNVKLSTIESSLTNSFLEFNYIVVMNNFEQFFSGKVRARLYHEYFHTSYHEEQTTEVLNLNGDQQFVFDIMAGYGLRYTINNFKIGFQAGIGLPFNSLEFIEGSEHATSITTITEWPVVLNLNLQYAFELK